MTIMNNFSFKKSKFTLITLCLTFFFISSSLKAQEIQVKGIVKGKTYEKTETLNGVNILLKGTKTGTSSNKKGSFTFPKKLKAGDILVFSYLGFLKKSIKIKENTSFLNITLLEDDKDMLGALNSNKRYSSKRSKN